MVHTVLLTSLGEWLDSNPALAVGVVLQGIVAVFSAAGFFYTVLYMRRDLSLLTQRVEELDKSMDTHVKNKDEHVNQLYIGSLKDRITGLESGVKDLAVQMTQQHERLSDKIDTSFQAIMARCDAEIGGILSGQNVKDQK